MTSPRIDARDTVGPLAALERLSTALAGLSGWRQGGVAAVAGVLLTLAQPPLSLWPLIFVAWPTLFALLAGAARPRQAAWIGWCAGSGFFLTGLYWVGEAFLVEAERVWWYLPLMPLAIVLLGTGLALFWAGGFASAAAMGASRGGWRGALALATAIAVTEAVRGTVLTGFPWALPAYVWVETPVMQVAALGGSYALSGLTVLAALLVALARPLPVVLAALLVGGGWLYGAQRLAAPVPPPAGPVVRLVQPSIPQGDKWRPENRVPIFRDLVELSAGPAAVQPALVVWPEVAVTFIFDESPDAIEIATGALPEGSLLAVGAVRRDRADPRRMFNSLLFFDGEGRALGTYDKRVLTPFGEYIPFEWALGWLGLRTLGEGYSGFTPGREPGPFSLPGLPTLAVLICYEIIFPGLTRRTAQPADWIVQVTNDAWFGESAGPRQHLSQARVRAIETGLPIARAANSGISAMIDPHGRLTATLGLWQRGALDAPLPGRLEPPLYARWGVAIPLGLLALALSLLLSTRPRTARKVA